MPSRRMNAPDWVVAYLAQHGESRKADVVAAGVAAGYRPRAIEASLSRKSRIVSRRLGTFPPVALWRLADDEKVSHE